MMRIKPHIHSTAQRESRQAGVMPWSYSTSLQAFGDSWELLMSTGEPVRQNKAEHPLWGYSCFLITYYKAASPPSLKLTVAQLVLDQIPPELPSLCLSKLCRCISESPPQSTHLHEANQCRGIYFLILVSC